MNNIESIYPLSPMQHGMLFHCLYAPKSEVYFEQFSCTLRGGLDVEAFRRAWQKVVDRHPVLRTSFLWERREKPLQIVQRKVKLPFALHDWRELKRSRQQEQLEELIQADRAQGFDLARAPLMRQVLIRVSDDAYQFLWSRSQLLLDGWSNPLLLREVFGYYEAYRHGRELELERPRPYRDYILWLQRQDMAQAEKFWRRVLAGFHAPTPLGVDRTPALTVKDEQGVDEQGFEEQRMRLSGETTAALQALARKHQLTLNTLAQGAWALLLSRYSGEEDVLFGGVVSGRPAELAGSETMVGIFINTLPVRVQAPAGAKVLPWLRALQEAQVEARQYEYSPLVQVQGWSAVPRGVPLFESILVFENYPVSVASASGEQGSGDNLQIEQTLSTERTNYPLTVMMGVGAQLSLRILYERARFEEAAVKRMLGHMQNLLEGIAADPEQRLAGLPLLSPPEREQLLFEFNETRVDYPSKRCVHELLEQQAEQKGGALAVVCGDERLTYAELNARANKLAHHLRGLGVGPGVRVGICVERSIEMLLGVLGVLKAGGAYVPLDPSYPKARLAFMLSDAQVLALLTQESLAGDLPPHGARVVRLDSDWKAFDEESVENLRAAVSADDAAYVIYTSGSTGEPKGVQIPHRAVVNFLSSMSREPGLSSEDVLLAVTTLSFDIAGLELYLPLLVGARLIVATREEMTDGALLLKQINQQGVTAMQATPATWQMLIEAKWQGDSLLKVICGGEALPRSLATQLRLRSGSVWNMYGPTETTIWSSLSAVELDDAPVTIGRPIDNTQIYLLDREMQPVPPGVAGELYIGGAGLAHGYLNRPALTAEKFVPDPFGAEAGARLYRTGDLARYLERGQIEFLGRIDQQVKVRGYRIELGEIETALASHPKVRSAVVVTREDVAGDKRLVAYLVLENAAQPATTNEWRGYLKEKLPDYMIPQAFVLLDSLPLTPNGKIDRRALPAPERTGTEAGGSYTAPGNAIEEVIAGIWCEVLGVERVGSLDNFFELGGHSLLATQIISRVREALGSEAPIRLLFETRNLAEFAASIEAARLNEQGLQAPPIQVVSRDAALPLSFSQHRLWFLDQMSPGNNSYNIAAPVRLKGPLNTGALELSLMEIVRRHEVLRTSFPTVNGEPRQLVGEPYVLEMPLIELGALPPEEREAEARRLAREEAAHAFDLARGPLMRVRLLRLDVQDHLLLLTMHHIITDGWSMGVLIREMSALYEAFNRGEASPLPELPFQYADFAHWQRQWLQGEMLERQLAYWQQPLGGNTPVLSLPTDRPRPAIQTFRGARQTVQLSGGLTAALKTLSRREGVTLFMTLLAAFKVLLYRYTGQEVVLVGTPVANRTRAELESLVGFFVNTLVLRTELSGELKFRELLARVREISLGAYEHQDLPFEQLVQEFQPQRDLSYTPLFQVMFDWQTASAAMKLESPSGLRLERWERDSRTTTAKFDLTLALGEDGDGISGSLEYNTDLFNDDTIERLIGHFETLLEAALANPDQRLSQLPLLSKDERRNILSEWNGERADYPRELCIHELFEAQVEIRPDDLAVVSEAESLSYSELNRRTNQLAHYLRSLGVGPETLVGILIERSVEMVVAVLGVLKAGGAYVPLDPSYPQARLAYMLNDTSLRIVLTKEHLLETLGAHDVQAVCLDTHRNEISKHDEQNPANRCAPLNTAYVIYTSGSTGEPKGVLIPHRAVVNHGFATSSRYELQPADRVLQFASLSFDVAVEEMFPTWLRGACVVLRPEWMLDSHAAFFEFIAREKVTVVNLSTPYWNELMAELKRMGGRPGIVLRVAAIGGEIGLPEQFAQTKEVMGDALRLLNVYGPTETTVTNTAYEFSRERELAGAASVPLGRPIANNRIYILDGHGQLAPVGVTGELYIGGDNLARGYLKRPALTAEKFVPDNFSEQAGQRLYRTGDLGRLLPDGNIEFVGRVDHQVKVRGFRIEVGEIESVLSAHPAVGEVCVLVREDVAGDRRIVAYIVANAQTTQPAASELRAYLKERLPDYMVPSIFITLAEMPLTSNKKVDRRALPAPERVRQGDDEEVAVPRDAFELQLAHIWEEVLGVQPVGVQDNFFDLGGHSFLAVSLMGRIEREFGVKLPLAVLFQGATVETLGIMLRQQVGASFASSLVKIQPHGTRPPLFCAHPGGGNVICYMELARSLNPEQPVYGLQARGLNGEADPLTRLEEMAAHYIEEIRAVQPAGPYHLLGWSLGGILAFEMARQLEERGERVALVALLDTAINDPADAPKELRELDDAEMLLGAIGEPSAELLAHLRTLQPDEQLQYVVDWAHRVNALPPDFGLAQFRHLFNIFKINDRALRNYVPKIYPGQVTLFRAAEQLAKEPQRLLLGWDKFARGGVDVHVVPGNHFNMAYRPHVRTLCEQLDISLDRAMEQNHLEGEEAYPLYATYENELQGELEGKDQ
jgi:amino acid adenylation domain-containing protein